MKKAFPVLVLLLAIRCEAAPREVEFNCVGLLDEGPMRPVLALDALLVQKPRVRRFRLVWSGSRLGTMAIYDRRHQTLLVEKRDDVLLNDDDDDPPRRTAQLKRWMVSGVTRVQLHQLLHFYRDKSDDSDETSSHFLQLNQFGCRVRLIADFQRTYFVPQSKPSPR